jgi:ParB family chromosome partitioning protein
MTQELQQFWPHDLVAGEAVNVRPGDEDVSDLLGSIAAHGLLQPLVGRSRPDGTVEIIDGNRRLKALKQLFDEEKLRDIVPVMLRDQEADADAFEISLAANVLRRQLHPVAEFEAFAALIDKGKSNEEIAEHFGIPLRAVEQRQALGRLHPDVRKAWLEGRINGESARAFTIASPADQAAYLASVKDEHWQLRSDIVRRAFSSNAVPADRSTAVFVGEETYRAAGGQMVPDLFKERPDFADGGLLERLANEKLAAEAARIQAEEGWGEVLFGPAAFESYRWDRLRKPAAPEGTPAEDLDRASWLALAPEKRAKAIATLQIDAQGTLSIQRGYTKGKAPKEAPTAMSRPAPKPADPDVPEVAEPARLSAALLNDLALTATRAAAFVLAEHPRIAFAALVATHAAYGSPIRYSNSGRGEGRELDWTGRSHNNSDTNFGTVFREALGMQSDKLDLQVSRMIAHTLDFTSSAILNHNYDSLKPDAVSDLRAALPTAEHRAALVRAFDAAEYFSKAPKQEAIAAIRDCGDDPGKHAKLKKADLGAVATRLATERGWLPEILRGEIFDAVQPLAEPDGETEALAPEPEDTRTAAEAADQIWRDQDRLQQAAGDVAELKAPELRARLKEAGVKIPFGATREALLDLVRGLPVEEAA